MSCLFVFCFVCLFVVCMFVCCLYVWNGLSSLRLHYLFPNPLMKDYSWIGTSHALGMATIAVLYSPAIGPLP